MDVNDSHLRHPREGGDPCKHLHMIGQVSWMPASAGMTTGLAIAAFLFDSSPVFAHTELGHAFSFASGFAHPWTALDHVLAMVAVGLWAGLNGGRALWIWPAGFVGVMLPGGALGIAGVPVPLVEPGILA